jgi:hypothetical protein
MIVGAVIVVLPMLSLIPSSKETNLYDQVVSTLFTTTDARDVSNPPAGLQDQLAALDRHRDQAKGFRQVSVLTETDRAN